MDVNKINGTQLCKNCKSCDIGNRGRCTNPKAEVGSQSKKWL